MRAFNNKNKSLLVNGNQKHEFLWTDLGMIIKIGGTQIILKYAVVALMS